MLVVNNMDCVDIDHLQHVDCKHMDHVNVIDYMSNVNTWIMLISLITGPL